MIIETLRAMTVGQLLKSERKLKEVTYNTDKSQVILKDGTFTVKSLRRLAGFEVPAWGA